MRSRSGLLAAGFAGLFATTAVMAAGPVTTGLGQSWPSTADVSTTPHYHVYVFQKQGVRYVQVNDASGTVRGAIAYTAADSVLDLPIGVDAGRWVTPTDGSAKTAPAGEQVYRDEAVSISAAPQGNGTTRLMVASNCDDPRICSIQMTAH